MSFKNLVDTVGQLMNQLAPEKLSEFRQMNKEENRVLSMISSKNIRQSTARMQKDRDRRCKWY